ncbi:hypothetical protein TNCV_2890181 [Trichonephila clavipes]|nr:hypothetical protein TNCV_2890181 [Trichonephila clavipes]
MQLLPKLVSELDQEQSDSHKPNKFIAQQSVGKMPLTAFSTYRDPYYWNLRNQTSPSMPNGTPKCCTRLSNTNGQAFCRQVSSYYPTMQGCMSPRNVGRMGQRLTLSVNVTRRLIALVGILYPTGLLSPSTNGVGLKGNDTTVASGFEPVLGQIHRRLQVRDCDDFAKTTILEIEILNLICDGSICIPSINLIAKSLGYQFALFTTNPSEEENRDI